MSICRVCSSICNRNVKSSGVRDLFPGNRCLAAGVSEKSMDTQQSYVIVGNGIAGVTAAEILRAQDRTGAITLVADDPFPAYYRPGLKDFLGGTLSEEKLWARPTDFYRKQRLRFTSGRVTAISPREHVLHLHNGSRIPYHKLLLANGARARTLNCAGLELAGVSTLRTVADYQEVLRRLAHSRRVVVCGSGTLALESAETLQHSGYEVTHLLRGRQLWSEVLDLVASDMVLHEERRVGIDVRLETEIAEIVGRGGQVCGIRTTRGEYLACELVLIAVGIEPLIDCIRPAGIACRRGVLVDHAMRTNQPDIYAAGDVIETVDQLSGQARVPGQWYPAIQQAQVAAHSMLGAESSEGLAGHFYNATFLRGLDFVSIGLTTCPSAPGFVEVVAEPAPRSYRKVIMRNGTIVGALLLGERGGGMALKRAIDHRVALLPIAEKVFTEGFELDAWLDQQGVPPPFGVLESMDQSTDGSGDEGAPPVNVSEADAYLVPVPHAGLRLNLTEVQLNGGVGTNPFVIGRQSGVAWTLDHRSISRQHAQIMRTSEAYILRDSGSSNGTFVNGVPLEGGQPYILRQHDLLRLGDIQVRFDLRARGQTAQAFAHLQGSELAANFTRLVPPALLRQLPSTPALVYLGPDLEPGIFSLAQGERFLLGRDGQCHLVLPDASVSRQHAELFRTPEGFFIRDLRSSYGVFVNRVKITNVSQLSDGDQVVLGNILLSFSQPGTRERTAPTTARMARVVAPKPPVEVAKPVVTELEHRREIKALSQTNLAFEIDMCIGCHRCMDACPIPMSDQITIAALNHATLQGQLAPEVERFTHECIMCGSCVPVCPVDDHRDLLMLALKQRVGVSWEKEPDMQRVVANLPTGWSLPLLLQRLREQKIFDDAWQVPDAYLLHIVAASRRVVLAPGEPVLREGAYGRDLSLVLDGQIALTTSDREGSELVVALLRRGEYLGEDGMLTGLPYKNSAHAQLPALLLQIPEQVMQRVMELVPAVREHFERFHSQRSLQAILRRMDLFADVSDADLQALARQTPVTYHERSERLFAEDRLGRPPREALHILLEGFVSVARHKAVVRPGQSSERIIAYRQGGDYFAGGLDLLGDGQSATVTTINRCRVAQVPRPAVLALFQRYPAMEARFALRLREYLGTAAATSASTRSDFNEYPTHEVAHPEVQVGLHELVSDGVVEGTEVLVIDLDKCIHCNECEAACERRHGHSRMNRKGMVVGNISITTTCRQCQDPVCMLCSRAGIARHPNGEVYITESCIGCGICAERCPYGAISIAQIDDEPEARSTWQRFSSLIVGGATRERSSKLKELPMVSPRTAGGSYAAAGPLDASAHGGYEELRKKIAIKCDLCAGYSNQACVEACPAGAAFRVQPASFFGTTEDILRRRLN